MKKLLVLLVILLFGTFLSGCSFLTMTFDFPTTTTTTLTTTMPNTINGTISLGDLEYSTFSYYESDTYLITNVDEYNDVLLNTRDMIRKSNVEILTTLYTEAKVYPWSTQTVRTAVGSSLGSGVIFLEDETYYYALTNHHVIDNDIYDATYQIKAFEDSDESEAILVCFDESLDLAVVKFLKNDRQDIHLMDISTRLYTKFTEGELVLAVGNPLSVLNNVTFGEFRGMETIENADFKVILHNASIHEGSSGGALVDVDGNLLGLNTWGYSTTDEYSFSVPIYIIYMFLINNGII
ncbi:MAG: S1C family serine protease [Firmicutes bacterium]|nr:S1C family serine protease [Bacillota bacterium]